MCPCERDLVLDPHLVPSVENVCTFGMCLLVVLISTEFIIF